MTSLRIHLLFSFCLSAPLTVLAQTAPPAPISTDPIALMSLAREKNGLTSVDVHPWHIRGSYTTFDDKGKIDDTGVYEEWWFSPSKYKRSYTGTKFNQTDYATGAELYRVGEQHWPIAYAAHLRSDLIEPLPADDTLKEFTPQLRATSFGKAKLSCVKLTYPLRSNLTVSDDFFPSSCFEQALPMLRFSSLSTRQTTYNQIGIFKGHYLAHEVRSSSNGKPQYELKLEVIEACEDQPDSILKPPVDALPIDISTVPLRLEKAPSWLVLLKQAVPVYPQVAKDRRIQGSVVLRVTIGTDGHVSSIGVVSGPPELRQAATDAVQQWYYRPFFLMGKPVEIETDLTVNFNLG